MIELPMGDFVMGAPEGEFRRNVTWYDGAFRPVTPEHQWVVPYEGPQRHVTVDIPFAMGRDEVTYDQWMACANDGGCGGYVPPPELEIPAHPGIKSVDMTGTMPVIWVDTADALL